MPVGDSYPGRCRPSNLDRKGLGSMQMLADQVDAVVGVDTHRDTHTAVVLNPVGRALAETTVTNDEDGFAALVGWIAQGSPGPRIVVAMEGSRSYGIGLARHLAAAGFQVLEIEQ